MEQRPVIFTQLGSNLIIDRQSIRGPAKMNQTPGLDSKRVESLPSIMNERLGQGQRPIIVSLFVRRLRFLDRTWLLLPRRQNRAGGKHRKQHQEQRQGNRKEPCGSRTVVRHQSSLLLTLHEGNNVKRIAEHTWAEARVFDHFMSGTTTDGGLHGQGCITVPFGATVTS
jgi:hypothetical protein